MYRCRQQSIADVQFPDNDRLVGLPENMSRLEFLPARMRPQTAVASKDSRGLASHVPNGHGELDRLSWAPHWRLDHPLPLSPRTQPTTFLHCGWWLGTGYVRRFRHAPRRPSGRSELRNRSPGNAAGSLLVQNIVDKVPDSFLPSSDTFAVFRLRRCSDHCHHPYEDFPRRPFGCKAWASRHLSGELVQLCLGGGWVPW